MSKIQKSLFLFSLWLIVSSPAFSQDPRKLSLEGVDLSDHKKYNEAAKKFDDAIEIYNNASAKAYHNKGYVHELKGEYDTAIKAYEEAMRRNPLQLPTYERAGYLYFKTGAYFKAVDAGEFVLKMDPKNQKVITWLPEAYKMKIQKQQEMLRAAQLEEKRKKEELKKKQEEKKIDEKKEEKKRLIYATYDAMIRTGYFINNKKYKFIATPGYYGNFPQMFYVNVTPLEKWEFDLEFGNPYFGAIAPNLVNHRETIQAKYHLGKYVLGTGMLINHYHDNFNFGKYYTLHDFKVGMLFGVEKEKAVYNITFYPRLLPLDTEQSTGKTMDVSYIAFDYDYTVDRYLSYHSKISATDFFYFDHSNEYSNYYGVYEIGFGVSLGRYNKITGRKYLTFTVEFTELFYLQDLNNTRPYKFANGQGWFGADASNWFKGKPFPGYYTNGHALTFKAEEPINEYIFLYQKFIMEITGGKGNHHEFSLLLGVGGSY